MKRGFKVSVEIRPGGENMAERGDIEVFYCPDCKEKRAHVYTINEKDRSISGDKTHQCYIYESFGGYYYAVVWKCTTCNRMIIT